MDPDGDGYSNKFEYYFGMDPTDAGNQAVNKKPAHASVVDVAGTLYPAIEFSYRNGLDGSSIAYEILSSTDLSDWTTIAPSPVLAPTSYTLVTGPTPNGDNTSTIKFRYNLDLTALPNRLFMRIKATE